MNDLHSYSIAYKGLCDGSHRYDFKVGSGFFGQFGNSDIKGGDLDVAVDLSKKGSLMLLDFRIVGSVTVECDRCLEDLPLEVDYRGRLTVRVVAEAEEESADPDVMSLSAGEDSIPLAQYIYESIYLSLPYQRVHPDGPDGVPGCDPDMLARFSIVTGEEFDAVTGVLTQEVSPEWAKLEQLKDKMKNED